MDIQKYVFIGLFFCLCGISKAARFELIPGQEIYGQQMYTVYDNSKGIFEFTRKYDVAHDVFLAANPNLNNNLVEKNTVVILPKRFILPAAPKKGIVINVAERRLYFYHPSGKYVDTFPVSIGKKDWETPLGRFKIVNKKKNPVWYVPKSLFDAQVAKGVDMPKYVLPGEDNPLGKYAMRLSITSYLIHGTNMPERIGRRQTAGCVSLYPEDIERLFSMVKVDTPVTIIDQPVKMAYHEGQLWVESHEALDDDWRVPSFKEPSNKEERKMAIAYKRWKKSENLPDELLMKVIKDHVGVPRKVKG